MSEAHGSSEAQTRPVDEEGPGRFDRFATWADGIVSRPVYFALSLLAILLWAIWGPFAQFSSTWQLVINTGTTIITFLLVSLNANSQARGMKAIHLKLNAIASGLEDLMEDKSDQEREDDSEDLREAVGLEHETGSKT